MLTKVNTLSAIVNSGVVAIIRTNDMEEAENISLACLAGGIEALEVTFTTPNAQELIQRLHTCEQAEELILGAGSVLDAETARIAILAGAKYIVSPCFDKETAKLCNRYAIPYLPGCMTINEIKTAAEYGVDIIKLFPSHLFEPGIIKSIKGPLPHVAIMPTGGVNLKNAGAWIKNGAVAIGIGSELTKPAQAGDYERVSQLAREYCRLVQETRQVQETGGRN